MRRLDLRRIGLALAAPLLAIVVAFVVICGLFALRNPNFLSPGNLTNLVLQYSYILILAIGMMIVIIAGHIDLSVGSVVALTGAAASTRPARGPRITPSSRRRAPCRAAPDSTHLRVASR